MSYDKHTILQYLDNPIRYGLWTADEISILFVPIFLALGFDLGFVGLLIGAGGYYVLRSFKKNVPGGLLRHAIYWYLPNSLRNHPNTPPSYVREFIG